MKYIVRYIELLSLYHKGNKSFLHIKMTLDNDYVETHLEVDPFTSEKVQKLVIFNQTSYKYRLSLRTVQNPTDNSHWAFITAISMDQSVKICFPCSTMFAENLAHIKDCTDLVKLSRMTNAHVHKVKKIIGGRIASAGKLPARTKKINKPKGPARKVLPYLAICAAFLVSFLILENSDVYSSIKIAVGSESKPVLASGESRPVLLSPLGVKETELTIKTTPTYSPQTAKLKQLISFNINEKEVALTFDDGPSAYTKDIVNILDEHRVGGTFFFIGKKVKDDAESVKYASDHGYSIGNHSFSHPPFDSISPAKQKHEIETTNTLIRQITSQPVSLFRLPYGAKGDATVDLVKENNMKLVMWNGDTEDWKTRSTAETLHYVVNTDSGGAIYLLHEVPSTVQALPKIINYLKKQGLEIVGLK